MNYGGQLESWAFREALEAGHTAAVERALLSKPELANASWPLVRPLSEPFVSAAVEKLDFLTKRKWRPLFASAFITTMVVLLREAATSRRREFRARLQSEQDKEDATATGDSVADVMDSVALGLSFSKEWVAPLIEKGLSMFLDFRVTPVGILIERGDHVALSHFFEHATALDMTGSRALHRGSSPFLCAAQSGRASVLRVLVERFDVPNELLSSRFAHSARPNYGLVLRNSDVLKSVAELFRSWKTQISMCDHAKTPLSVTQNFLFNLLQSTDKKCALLLQWFPGGSLLDMMENHLVRTFRSCSNEILSVFQLTKTINLIDRSSDTIIRAHLLWKLGGKEAKLSEDDTQRITPQAYILNAWEIVSNGCRSVTQAQVLTCLDKICVHDDQSELALRLQFSANIEPFAKNQQGDVTLPVFGLWLNDAIERNLVQPHMKLLK